MQQGLNVIGSYAGEKKRVFEGGENGSSTSFKYGVSIPSEEGYEGQAEYFEITVPKAEHHGELHKAFQALQPGQLIQVFFRKNSGEVNGRAFTNYNPVSKPLLQKAS